MEPLKEVVAFLLPFLPYLRKWDEKAAEEAGKKLGEDAWKRAKTLWSKLCPMVEAHPPAQQAIATAAAAPQDAHAQAALRQQIEKLLKEDETEI